MIFQANDAQWVLKWITLWTATCIWAWIQSTVHKVINFKNTGSPRFRRFQFRRIRNRRISTRFHSPLPTAQNSQATVFILDLTGTKIDTFLELDHVFTVFFVSIISVYNYVAPVLGISTALSWEIERTAEWLISSKGDSVRLNFKFKKWECVTFLSPISKAITISQKILFKSYFSYKKTKRHLKMSSSPKKTKKKTQ